MASVLYIDVCLLQSTHVSKGVNEISKWESSWNVDGVRDSIIKVTNVLSLNSSC